jgi:signal transduction histidine kinase
VVVGTSPIEQFWRTEIAKAVKPLENRVAFTWYDDLSFEDILKHAAALPPDSAIFWELMSVDAAGVVHKGNTALARLHAVANAPIFSYDESFFGNEIVGGPLLSVIEGGRQTAAMALRILGGEKAGEIRIPPIGFATPKFDWREMQRWGISENRLPPGSQVLFREPTVWERYSWQITLVAAVLLFQAGLIAILLREHRRRQFAELESRHRMTELARVNRFSTAGEMSAMIAHEINQPLGAILSNAAAAQRLLNSSTPDMAMLSEIVNDIRDDDERAAEVIRRIRSLVT